MTFEELLETLDNLAELEPNVTKMIALSEASALIVRQQIVIQGLEAEVQRLERIARYD